MMRGAACLLLSALALSAQVRFFTGAGKIEVEIDGKPFTTFFYGAEAPKPYLHPLRTAEGIVVTRAFPMSRADGETLDHPHHRGVWFTHGDVNGVDFWANEPPGDRKNLGRVVVSGTPSAKGQSIDARFDWVGPAGNRMLAESRRMSFYPHPRLRTIDFDITLTALERVKFGDTKEGTFAVRVASGLEAPATNVPSAPPRTGKMVDAEGRESEANVWGKRAAWVDVYGAVEGHAAGIAILDHPSNPHYPTFWHCRAYGLCAANIFGAHDFMNDKTQDASITLAPGETLRFRYRVVVHPDDPKTAGIAAIHGDFAASR